MDEIAERKRIEDEIRMFRQKKQRERTARYYREHTEAQKERVRKYQKTEKGRAMRRKASKAWYDRNKHKHREENRWIKPAVEAMGWSQKALGQALGYADGVPVSKMVQGVWKAPTEQIERILGVRKEEFL